VLPGSLTSTRALAAGTHGDMHTAAKPPRQLSRGIDASEVPPLVAWRPMTSARTLCDWGPNGPSSRRETRACCASMCVRGRRQERQECRIGDGELDTAPNCYQARNDISAVVVGG